LSSAAGGFASATGVYGIFRKKLQHGWLYLPELLHKVGFHKPSEERRSLPPVQCSPDRGESMEITEQSHEEQVRRLSVILSPARSKIRPYLGLYGVKNHVLLRNGCLEGNSPTAGWYLNHLKQAGISQNYWNVRRNLRGMAELGIFTPEKTIRLVENNLSTHRRLTRVEVCEFYLEGKLFPAMLETLRTVFRTDSLSSVYLTNKQTTSGL
jgi:hypothetical protein